MPTRENNRGAIGSDPRGGLAAGLLGAALSFVLVYLSVDFIAPQFADSTLPLPNAPAAEAKAWYDANPVSAIVIGVLQLLSATCLAVFVTLLSRTGRTPAQASELRAAGRWGYLAVALMLAFSFLSWLLAVTAGSLSTGTVGALRTANFIAGGTAHVMALGMFVLLATRASGAGRGVRILGVVAAVPAVGSVIALVVFEGAALILLGRLLCMVWTITLAISIGRRIRYDTQAVPPVKTSADHYQ